MINRNKIKWQKESKSIKTHANYYDFTVYGYSDDIINVDSQNKHHFLLQRLQGS